MRILKRIGVSILAFILILFIIFLLGPKVHFENVNNEVLQGLYTIEQVQKNLATRNLTPSIKPDNDEQIIWFDGEKKTPYSIVYLHGFSASHGEGAPLHKNIAKRYGANLFLTRLPYHGLDNLDAFVDITPESMVEYAKEAIKIGKSIGEKVILISCSTGSTLSAYLAAEDDDIAAMIMLSPNFELYDPAVKVITKPWGFKIAKKIAGGEYHSWDAPDAALPYWYDTYRMEGVAALQSLLDQTMKDEIFKKISHPIFVGYFYKDEEVQDFTISVEKIREVDALIKTPADQKQFIAYPDGDAHVFNSPIFNDEWEKVQTDIYSFMEDILRISEMIVLEEVIE